MNTQLGLLQRVNALLEKKGYKERILWLKYLKGFNLVLIASMVDFEAWVLDKMSQDFISYI